MSYRQRWFGSLIVFVVASGCTRDLVAPQSPHELWTPSKSDLQAPASVEPFPPETPAPRGEGGYNLPEAIDQALSNNPQTQVAWRAAQAAAAARTSAASPFYPELSGAASFRRSRSQFAQADLTRDVTEGAPRLDLTYLLFDFGERFASLRAAEESLRSSNFQFNRILQEIIFESQRRFFLFDAAQAAVVAAQQTVEEAKRSFEAAQKGFAVGSRPRQDVLQAEAVLRRAEFDLQNSAALKEDARAAFAEILGVRVDKQLAIRSPDYGVFEKRVAGNEVVQMIDAALRQRPDLQAVYADARAAYARRDVAVRADLPKLVGAMSGGKNYLYSGGEGIEDNYSIGIELQVPLFTGFRNQSRIRQEEALAKSAQEQSRAKEISVAREVWSAFFRFEASQRQIQAARALTSASEESYKAVWTGYSNGANSVLDLLAAQRDLSDARKSLIAAQANCGIAFAELTLVSGALDRPVS